MRQSMIITAQDHALNTNNMRNKEFGKNVSPMCRFCSEKYSTRMFQVGAEWVQENQAWQIGQGNSLEST